MVRPTIFIQIAAYRDPDLPATLENLLEMATHPDRLHIGVCLQLDDRDPTDWDTAAFPEHRQLSLIRFRAQDSQGACWARHQAQQFFANETFLLQIDSHMRAIRDWDELLIQTWAECQDPMAVLSVYPNGFKPPCTLQCDSIPVMAAHQFDDDGILKFQGISRYRLPDQQPSAPLPSAFAAGGFLFGPGELVSKVPYDSKLYFYGEEISLSVRLWTHGFNIYCPHRLLLFHLYKTTDESGDSSTQHWSDHQNWFRLNRRSLVRVHTLLGSLDQAPLNRLKPQESDVEDLDHFCLGDVRNLDDYQRWAGVDFKARTITSKALAGHFGPEREPGADNPN